MPATRSSLLPPVGYHDGRVMLPRRQRTQARMSRAPVAPATNAALLFGARLETERHRLSTISRPEDVVLGRIRISDRYECALRPSLGPRSRTHPPPLRPQPSSLASLSPIAPSRRVFISLRVLSRSGTKTFKILSLGAEKKVTAYAVNRLCTLFLAVGKGTGPFRRPARCRRNGIRSGAGRTT